MYKPPLLRAGVFITLLGALLLPAGTALAQMPEMLTLHPVPKLDQAPKLDGKLDDAAWKTATEYNTFYFFFNWKPPKPAVPDTTFWIGYTDQGLYLAIANYRDDMENVRANVTTRDDGGLWKDSSNEVYIDSTGTAISYRKFTVNSIGTKADQFQLDAANRFNSWTKSTWKAKTSRDDKGWYIELFFPFDILGDIPAPGETWRFAVTRFPHTIRAGHSASAPGAMYSKPQNFGWLYFLEDTDIKPAALGKAVAESVSRDWFLPYGDALLIRRGDEVEVSTMAAVLRQVRKNVQADVARTEEIMKDAGEKQKKKLASLRTKLDELPMKVDNAARFSNVVGRMNRIRRDLEDMEYRRRLQRLFVEVHNQ